MSKIKQSKKKKQLKRLFLQVGRAQVDKRMLRYSDLISDKDGWVDDKIYKPINFDMMLLKVKNKVKNVPGWWNGMNWCGLHFKQKYEVIGWKRHHIYE